MVGGVVGKTSRKRSRRCTATGGAFTANTGNSCCGGGESCWNGGSLTPMKREACGGGDCQGEEKFFKAGWVPLGGSNLMWGWREGRGKGPPPAGRGFWVAPPQREWGI